ncbi:MAG: ABC-2 family transporter protein [Myxococcota bacterium]|nr:ABC-2 family transporter protein [Myxococcota bacterium]
MRPASRHPRHQAFQRTARAESAYTTAPTSRLAIYGRYLLMRAKVRLAYRGDFLLNAVGDLLVAAIGVVFLWAVFSHVPDIAGWSFSEVLLIWGLAETSTGLFFVLFQGLWHVNQRYLLQGELDRVLLRPLDPYTQVLLDNINLEDLPVGLLGVGMIAVALPGLPPLSWSQWVMLPVFVAGGVAILGGVLTGVSSAGFRIHHRGTAVGLVYQSAVFNRYPLDIFHQRIQLALTWVVPFAFVAFFPATWYCGRTEWLPFAFAQPVVAAVVLIGGVGLWRRGMLSYRSPGS